MMQRAEIDRAMAIPAEAYNADWAIDQRINNLAVRPGINRITIPVQPDLHVGVQAADHNPANIIQYETINITRDVD